MGKKDANLESQETTVGFWLCGGLVAALLVSIMARDISRPFYGLHSWDEAAAAWRARAFLKYNISYTKGFAVWAVGNPPTKNPNRSLDHPQLKLFLPALEMSIFGINEAATRIGRIIRATLSLLIFLAIIKRLIDRKAALAAGFVFAILPITGYFGGRTWTLPIALLAFWYYLTIIGSLRSETKPYYKWILAVLLFLALQVSWNGFFYALAIGVHYVFRCIHRRQRPDRSLLAILIAAPVISLMLDFTIMAAGHGWDWQKIWLLYKWRASTGELQKLTWSMWLGRFWHHALTNFTLPVLVVAILYLTLGQLFVFTTGTGKKDSSVINGRFPQFFLFLMPAVFQLLLLRGALWPHQYWEYPLVPFLAIAAGVAVTLVWNIVAKVNRRAAGVVVVLLVGTMFVYCMKGLNYYYSIRWQAPSKIKMFKELHNKIPPDKALLSFESFMINQNPVKGPHYRPEIAWYLDREITQARTLEEIRKYAASGRYPFYLIPSVKELSPLINQLSRLYKYEYVPGEAGETTKDGEFLKARMMPYMIFDLTSPAKTGKASAEGSR